MRSAKRKANRRLRRHLNQTSDTEYAKKFKQFEERGLGLTMAGNGGNIRKLTENSRDTEIPTEETAIIARTGILDTSL